LAPGVGPEAVCQRKTWTKTPDPVKTTWKKHGKNMEKTWKKVNHPKSIGFTWQKNRAQQISAT